MKGRHALIVWYPIVYIVSNNTDAHAPLQNLAGLGDVGDGLFPSETPERDHAPSRRCRVSPAITKWDLKRSDRFRRQ